MNGRQEMSVFATVLEALLVVIIVSALAAVVWLVRRYQTAAGAGQERVNWFTAHQIVAGVLESHGERTPLVTEASKLLVSEPADAEPRDLMVALAAIQATVNTYTEDEPELSEAVLSALRAHT